MLRRPFTLLSAASLVLCLATAVLWVRSYAGADYVSRSRPAAAGTGTGTPGVFTTETQQILRTGGDLRVGIGEHTAYVRGEPVQGPAGRDPPARWNWTTGRLGPWHMGADTRPGGTVWERAGFYRYAWGFSSSFADQLESGVAVPGWLPPLAFAVVPLVGAVRGAMRRRLRRAGRCAGCGYDLRATPEAGGALLDRCPECGIVPVPSHA